jgi:chorismate synthase
MPSGLPLEASFIDHELARRQMGYGRGGRMKIERDQAEILSGVRRGKTLGSPIALQVRNRDWKNWTKIMNAEPGGDESVRRVSVPRPGHADYAGGVKYKHSDLRNVLERASARETTMRVAVAAAARRLLEELGVSLGSRVVSVGHAVDKKDISGVPAREIGMRADDSSVRCLTKEIEDRMIKEIDAVKEAGDTLGGVFEVVVDGLPVGLGSYAQWDRRIEGELAAAFMSLNAIKGVEIGLGFESARLRGSEVHDALYWNADKTGVLRKTNRSGGVDGGLTTGEPLVLRVAMKPISTLMNPLDSVDLDTGEPVKAHVERSDYCAVPAASVIGEALACLVLADAFLVKFGGDSLDELKSRVDAWRRG